MPENEANPFNKLMDQAYLEAVKAVEQSTEFVWSLDETQLRAFYEILRAFSVTKDGMPVAVSHWIGFVRGVMMAKCEKDPLVAPNVDFNELLDDTQA